MCGIAGIHVKERYRGELPLEDMMDYLLVHIQERGEHATGYVTSNFGGIGTRMEKKDVKATEFIQTRMRPDMKDVQTILLHTRWATQGRPEDNRNNHPVIFGTTFATHNGHISNDDEVLDQFDLAARRPALVDSIAIPVALDHCGMDSIENIKKGLELLSGNMAVAAINPVKNPGQLVLAKGESSPLYILHHKTGFYWASTIGAINFMWGNLIGTPPTKETKNPNELGWYQMQWGEGWVIEGDEAAPFKFTPKRRSYNYSSYGHTDEPYKVTRYTCKPMAANCQTPCEAGCRTNACTCKTTLWMWRGETYAEKPDTKKIKKAERKAGARAARSNPLDTWDSENPYASGASSDGDGTAQVRTFRSDEAKVRCDSCWEWTPVEDLRTVNLGSQDFDLCDECYADEWGSCSTSVNEESKTPDEVVEQYQQIAEVEVDRRTYACQQTATSMACKPEFVEWILFHATLDELDQGGERLNLTRKIIDEEYEFHYKKYEEMTS